MLVVGSDSQLQLLWRSPHGRRYLVCAVSALVWLLCLGKILYLTVNLVPGVTPDELAHVSYVAYLEESGRLIPEVPEMRLLDADSGWSQRPNYLMHPPFYYHLLRLLPGARLQADTTPELIRSLRRANLWLSVAALTLMLWIGLRVEMHPLLHLLYAVTLLSVPMLCFGAAGVNNDSLALIAGAITIIALCRHMEGSSSLLNFAMIGAGVGLALLAKATAGILCCLLVALCLGWQLVRARHRLRQSLAGLLVIAALAAPGLGYYGVQAVRYQRAFPSAANLASDTIQPTRYQLAPGSRLDLPGWGQQFLYLLGVTWIKVSSHRYHAGEAPLAAVGLLIIPLLAVASLIWPRRLSAEQQRSRFGKTLLVSRVAAIACVLVAMIHFAYTFHIHRLTGYLGGAQARYYFPLLPLLLLLAVAALNQRRIDWRMAVVIVLLMVSLLYGDLLSIQTALYLVI
jgi:4-amino-4-deoxy-L-arabinose transferase-like glycosyltransferase